jgi:Fe-Mn family superoxide dismutase
MIENTEFENSDLITIIRASYGKNQGLFNNAAQSYNHEFYFNCMKQNGGGLPSENLLSLINRDFGDYDQFRDSFINAGLTAFGSGWAWLVIDTDGGLKVKNTIGANNPLTDENNVILLTMDVWEHAYYLNYQVIICFYYIIFNFNLCFYSNY